jgi:hypothetical protein
VSVKYPTKEYAAIASRSLEVEKDRKKEAFTRELLVQEDGTLLMYADPLLVLF